MRLTDTEIDKRIAAVGRDGKKTIPCGDRLYVQVVRGRASMLMRFKSPTTKKQRMQGLGTYSHRNLEKARDAIDRAERLIEQGIDPIEQRDADNAAKVAATIKFREIALDGYWPKDGSKHRPGYITTHAAEWSETHLGHWKATMRDWVFPHIGDLAIGRVTRTHVVDILNQPVDDGTLWTRRNPTARLVRQRIELVWNAGKAAGLVSGDCPADWPSMSSLFTASSAVHVRTPRRMLPWPELPVLYANLTKRTLSRSRALELLILTCARSKNIFGAQWSQFDLAAGLWTVPGSAMKNGLTWICPLSSPALAILRAIQPKNWQPTDLVFPGSKPGKPMAHDQLDAELNAAGCTDNVHGMRAAFRTWAADNGQDFLAAEFQLAHVEGSATVKAYQRSQLVELRRGLVEAWAEHVTGAVATASNVVRLHASQ